MLANVVFRANVSSLLQLHALFLKFLQCGARAVGGLLDVTLEVVGPSALRVAALPRARVAETYVGLLMAPEVLQLVEAFCAVVEPADVGLEHGEPRALDCAAY